MRKENISQMINYCLDTNVVSDIINDKYEMKQKVKDEMQNGNKIFISSIVYYEIVRGLKTSNFTNKLRRFNEIYDIFSHLYLDRESMKVIEKAADIYDLLHKGQQIEDNDIYIAAIAMVNNCILVTANEKHFCRIEGLKYINWRNY